MVDQLFSELSKAGAHASARRIGEVFLMLTIVVLWFVAWIVHGFRRF